MGRKVKLKVGDRVLFHEDTEVGGVIVHKHTEDSPLCKDGKIYSVHWHNPPPLTKRRDMKLGRGIYNENEIIKDRPKKKVVVDE